MSRKRYIFMGGTMRSGTSLTRAIIGSHSKAAVYPRDLPLWSFYEKYPKPLKEKKDWIKVVDEILAHQKAGYMEEGFRESAIHHFEEKSFNVPDFIRFFIDSLLKSLVKKSRLLRPPIMSAMLRRFSHIFLILNLCT